MNSTPTTTEGGYANSDMVKTTLETILKEYIEPDFKIGDDSHVLQYQNLLTNKTDGTRTNRFGIANNGASSGWGWYTRKLDLMSEMNVYGGIVASSSVFDTGIDNRQYAIFRLKPELIYSYEGKQIGHYWLKDVASSTYFASVDSRGYSSTSYGDGASPSYGVRPRFLIGEFSILVKK